MIVTTNIFLRSDLIFQSSLLVKSATLIFVIIAHIDIIFYHLQVQSWDWIQILLYDPMSEKLQGHMLHGHIVEGRPYSSKGMNHEL